MFAIIESGGKQHRVAVGDVLEVERFDAEVGSTVELDRVLMVADGTTVTTGHPTVPEARVVSTVLAEMRGPKIIVFKYKSKKRERKKTGHRQNYVRLRIEDIVVGDVSATSGKDKVAEIETDGASAAPPKRAPSTRRAKPATTTSEA